MSLTELRKAGTIQSVSSATNVTINNIAGVPRTGPVFKCIVPNLSKKILASPDSGASFRTGVAKLIDSNGNVGCFLIVNANPKPIAVDVFAANEVWLALADLSFWQAEYGNSQAADMTVISSPSAGLTIVFDTVTGGNPAYTDTITPTGWTGSIGSPTLRGHRQDASEDISTLFIRLNSIANFDLTKLLNSDHSILSGGDLSWSAGLNVNVSAGKSRFKGVEFGHAGGSVPLPKPKTLYRLMVDGNGVYQLQEENTTGGNPDADYNPSGTSPLPNASSPAWTLIGTGTPTVANGVLNMVQTATSFGYQRTGVVGPSASGSYQEIHIADITQITSASPFNIIIDDGVNREVINIKADGEISSNFNNRKVWLENPKKPFVLGISLKSGIATLYLNNAKIWDNAVGGTVANLFAFGFLSGVAGTGNVSISRVRTWNAGERKPSFADLVGCVLGTVLTVNSSFAKPIGLLTKGVDFQIGHINLDGWKREQVGKIFASACSFPDSDELILNGTTLNRTLYSALFFKIGTQDGVGDGSTTFNIANTLDRMIVGAGSSYLRGAIGGASTHTLDWNQMPAHNHVTGIIGGVALASGGGRTILAASEGYGGYGTGNAGSSQAHNNMPPYLALLSVIKFR